MNQRARKICLPPALLLLCLVSTCPAASRAPKTVHPLANACAAGRLDTNFAAAFREAVIEDIQKSTYNSAITSDFWPWLETRPIFRDEVLLAAGQVSPKVASNMDRLRREAASEVNSHPELAIAFAAAWAAGKTADPKRFWVDDWLMKGRPTPTMTDSFKWDVQREGVFHMSVVETPWPILAHLADSCVPLGERDWALKKYANRKESVLHGAFAAVPYTLGPKRKGEPCTLESFLRIGGPCTHNVQYADGVFDSFGIPSGWSGGPGHTYPYWFEEKKEEKGYSFHHINDLGTHNGSVRNPVGRNELSEDDLRILTQECALSERQRFYAGAGAWAFDHLSDDAPPETASILVAALNINPYSGEAIAALGRATTKRKLTPEAATTTWMHEVNVLQRHPEKLVSLFNHILQAPPKSGVTTPALTAEGETALLKSLTTAAISSNHEELLPKIAKLRAKCIALRDASGN